MGRIGRIKFRFLAREAMTGCLFVFNMHFRLALVHILILELTQEEIVKLFLVGKLGRSI